MPIEGRPGDRREDRLWREPPQRWRMKGNRRYIQGYNAQAVVNERQIVLAAEITTNPTDCSQLRPMLDAAI